MPLHLISSFLHTRSLLVSCAYVSIEAVDCILLSIELKSFLLIFSVKTLWLPLFSLCCVFNVTLLFFTNSWRHEFYCFVNVYFSLNVNVYFIFTLSCFWKVFIIFKFKFFYDALSCAFYFFFFSSSLLFIK